jgi:predicted TIM-barrel fold metal-dependent hydrolase
MTRAGFPVVDVHTHLGFKLKGDPTALDGLVSVMDRNNIAVCVSLDGRLGSQLVEHQKYLWTKYRDRFVIFAHLDWIGEGHQDQPETWACNQPGFVRHTVEQLKAAKESGVSGLKFFKRFGLGHRNADGSLIQIDDRRWDPIWNVCGELGLPIIMHTADPSAFFEPIDKTNERIEELSRHPDWSFAGDQFPTRAELHTARLNVVRRHRGTTFLAAHLGNDGEDLAETSRWLDENPNLYVEFASRISELGRQPYSARDFLTKYADRILFGTDGPWPEKRIRLYWRFLETRDQYFRYSEYAYPPQGFWRIYGVDLEPEVLEKIYHGNAARIIPGVQERLATYRANGNAQRD